VAAHKLTSWQHQAYDLHVVGRPNGVQICAGPVRAGPEQSDQSARNETPRLARGLRL